LMSCTWAKRRMNFTHSVVLCSSVYVCTPRKPNICSKGGNGSGYIDHNYIVFLLPLYLLHSVEFGDPVLDQLPLEEVYPTHHILVHYDSPCKYRIIIQVCDMRFGAFIETLDTVHEKWLITVCGPSPALMSCFCRSDFQVLVLRIWHCSMYVIVYFSLLHIGKIMDVAYSKRSCWCVMGSMSWAILNSWIQSHTVIDRKTVLEAFE
jgi:hypothetical protein